METVNLNLQSCSYAIKQLFNLFINSLYYSLFLYLFLSNTQTFPLINTDETKPAIIPIIIGKANSLIDCSK